MIQGSIAFLHPVIPNGRIGVNEVRLLGVPSTEPHQIFEKKTFFIHASIEPDLYMKPEAQQLLWWSGSRLENGDVEIFRKKGLSMGKHVRSPKHSKVDNFWITVCTLPPKRLCSNAYQRGWLSLTEYLSSFRKFYQRDCCQFDLTSHIIGR